MNADRLSARLLAVAELAGEGGCIADVGCDHGLLCIHLVRRGSFEKAVAMDVLKENRIAAVGNVKKYGLEERIAVRSSWGLRELEPGEADTLVIAGMGGKTLLGILEDRPEMARSFEKMVLQPQSEIPEVRRTLRLQGFFAERECMVLDGGKYYPMMQVHLRKREEMSDHGGIRPELADAFGAGLLKQRDPVLKSWLEREQSLKKRALESLERNTGVLSLSGERDERNEMRHGELEAELGLLKEALELYS